jgi:hypothetical protein
MAEYPTRWFDDTGRHAPFVNGVAKCIYRDRQTGEEVTELPPGALFFQNRTSSLICIVPCSRHKSGTTWWHIDGRASNCTMPGDTEHRCWVRHGEDGGVIHVDKNGHTCAAGAGSIQVEGFHGFLHHGVLRDC